MRRIWEKLKESPIMMFFVGCTALLWIVSLPFLLLLR